MKIFYVPVVKDVHGHDLSLCTCVVKFRSANLWGHRNDCPLSKCELQYHLENIVRLGYIYPAGYA